MGDSFQPDSFAADSFQPDSEPKQKPTYGGEIFGAVKRGLGNIVTGTQSLLTPHDTYGATADQEKNFGPLGRLLYNIPADLTQSLENAEVSRRESAKSGENYAGQVLAYGKQLPILGGVIKKAEEGGPGNINLSPQNVGGAVEGATTVAAPILAAKGAGAAVKAAPILRDALTKNTKGFPNLPTKAAQGAEDVFRATAPTETQQGFRENVEAAAGDLAEIAKQVDLKEKAGGIINPDMRFKAAEDAIREHLTKLYETERAPQIARNAVNPVVTQYSADAVEGLQYLAKNAGPSRIRNLASSILQGEGIAPLGAVNELAISINKELAPFESKTGSQQALTTESSKITNGLKSLDVESKQIINDELQRRGEAGISEYERRAAALHQIADRIGRRNNAVILKRSIPGIDYVKSLFGLKNAITSASQAAVADVNPGRTLQKGFEKLAESGLEPDRPTGTGAPPIKGYLGKAAGAVNRPGDFNLTGPDPSSVTAESARPPYFGENRQLTAGPDLGVARQSVLPRGRTSLAPTYDMEAASQVSGEQSGAVSNSPERTFQLPGSGKSYLLQPDVELPYGETRFNEPILVRPRKFVLPEVERFLKNPTVRRP